MGRCRVNAEGLLFARMRRIFAGVMGKSPLAHRLHWRKSVRLRKDILQQAAIPHRPLPCYAAIQSARATWSRADATLCAFIVAVKVRFTQQCVTARKIAAYSAPTPFSATFCHTREGFGSGLFQVKFLGWKGKNSDWERGLRNLWAFWGWLGVIINVWEIV